MCFYLKCVAFGGFETCAWSYLYKGANREGSNTLFLPLSNEGTWLTPKQSNLSRNLAHFVDLQILGGHSSSNLRIMCNERALLGNLIWNLTWIQGDTKNMPHDETSSHIDRIGALILHCCQSLLTYLQVCTIAWSQVFQTSTFGTLTNMRVTFPTCMRGSRNGGFSVWHSM